MKTTQRPGEMAIGFCQERWLKRMDKESTPGILDIYFSFSGLKQTFVDFPLLVFKGIYHYWI